MLYWQKQPVLAINMGYMLLILALCAANNKKRLYGNKKSVNLCTCGNQIFLSQTKEKYALWFGTDGPGELGELPRAEELGVSWEGLGGC
jgi:hypothetical protein